MILKCILIFLIIKFKMAYREPLNNDRAEIFQSQEEPTSCSATSREKGKYETDLKHNRCC